MKCEKCGVEIIDGTLCDNCKNNLGDNTEPVIEISGENNVVTEVPEAYDPVADLMNEPVVGTVSLEKSEVESTIPLGDNNSIPQMPTNENVVSVAPEVINEAPNTTENSAEIEKVETSTVQPSEVTPSQEVNNNPVNSEVSPKKNNAIIIIVCILAGVLLLGGLAVPFLIKLNSVNDLMGQADASTFVTEVQEYMNASSTKFMTDALKPENRGKSFEFTTNGNALDMSGDTKQYKINMNRNGLFTSVIIFDDNFCYMVSNEENSDLEIDKTIVTVNDIQKRTKNDNLNDGCFGEKVN